MTSTANKRTFSVDPHIIYSLIQAQAGTLGKALLECIMNSYDAGAKKIDIKVGPTTLSIIDDGKGFTTREEIEACFEVFGFKHEPGQRAYGQFGIGRAQLWNFCSTLWRTNTFSMDVDIKNKGLDYELKENLKQFDGLAITGKFYERQKTSDVITLERELAELAMYVDVEVTLNGKLISKDPSKEKWTHETPDAYIRLKEHGDLTVYNLGVKVRDYYTQYFGSGGLVVTKPGVRLALNMARNDILLTKCDVWKRIKPFLQAKSDERIKRKSTKLTEDEMKNLVTRVLAGEADFSDIEDRKVITDIQGKNFTLSTFLRAISEKCPASVAPKGTQLAERANILKYGVILAPVTLARFDVETPSELQVKLSEYFVTKRHWLQYSAKPERFNDDYKVVCGALNDEHTELSEKDFKPEEKALLTAISATQSHLVYLMRDAGVVENMDTFRNRALSIGQSETAEGWTDGLLRIVLNRNVAALAKKGLPGIMKVASVLLHEYLHEDSSTETHEHDMEFYERYERVNRGYGDEFGAFVVKLYRKYLAELNRRDLKVLSTQIDHADLLDGATDLVAPTSEAAGTDVLPVAA